jgi:chromosome segregation ATPase
LAHDKDRLHQENFNLRMQVFEHQKQTEQRLEELNSAKKNMARMLQVLHTKAVELSTMRLNEERLLLDNAKLRRVLKAKQGNEDLLECVKDTLKEVLEKDNEFCKNMTDTEPSALTYKDSIEIINFIIVDYVAGKQEHVQEVKRLNFQVRGYIEKIGSFKQNIVDLVMKIQSQGAAIKSQNEHNSELKKELDGVKNHLKELGHKLKARDDKIVQLKIAVDKEKNEKLPQTHQLKDQTEEEKRHSEISNKKEELEQNEMMPVSVIVEEMKMKMAKQEADYFASIQKYISNLDAMKTKVFSFLAIELLNHFLKRRYC